MLKTHKINRWFRAIMVFVVCLAVFGQARVRAGNKMYWTDAGTNKIQCANLDGTGLTDLVTGVSVPRGIAIDYINGKVYWTNLIDDTIQRANLDGTNVEDVLTLDFGQSFGIAIDAYAGMIYWTESLNDRIMRADLADVNNVEVLITGLKYVKYIALDPSENKMYWTDTGWYFEKVQRASMDGSNPTIEDLVTTGLYAPCGIALDVDAGKVYWADAGTGKIQRANMADGNNVEDLVIGLDTPRGIAIDANTAKIYWTDSGTGKIQCADMADGNNIQDLFIGLNNPGAIVIDVPMEIDTVYYVDDDAPGGNNGTNWYNAFTDLQYALTLAAVHPEIEKILVAQGQYSPDLPFGDREATFQLVNGLILEGGYGGFGELDPDVRDFDLYRSTLSGDLASNDTGDISDMNNISRSENSYHVVTGSATDPNAVLDGFTITAGNANIRPQPNGSGGGMYNDNYGSPTVINCTFNKNSAYWEGGGMTTLLGSPTVTNCKFINNSAKAGAGMFVGESEDFMLTNCIFSGNTAEIYGGGLKASETNIAITNCTFSGNTAGEFGGGFYNHGTGSSAITNSILWDNTAENGLQIAIDDCELTVSYSDIAGGEPAVDVISGTLNWSNNINADPWFVDFNGDDNIVGTEDDDLGLLSGSVCIDAGDNDAVPLSVTTDLDGRQRFIDDPCMPDTGNGTPPIVDMGAYESIGFTADGIDCDLINYDCTNWNEQAKLLASDGEAYDYFGYSSAIWNDTAIIGAAGADVNDQDSGAAYIFGLNDSNWVEQAILTASDGAEDDYFGHSVAIWGDAAIVGASGDDDNGSNSGSAYIFRFNGSSWVQETKLLASDGATSNGFGFSVAISGDIAVIGACYDNDDGYRSGSVYIFWFNGSNWVEEAKLNASDGSTNKWFGFSVAISDDTVIIGAPGDNDNGSNSGSAYIFRFNGSSWVEQDKLLTSDGAVDDFFGSSVGISGDTAVVGAYLDDDNYNNSGSAYIFQLNGASWAEQAKLTASDGVANNWFGYSVDISNDNVIIGTGSILAFQYQGSAYLFQPEGSNWVETVKLTASDGAGDDTFGHSVAISGNTAVIGANCNNENGYYSGAAYIFYITSNFITLYVDDDAPEDPGPYDPNISDPNEDGTPCHPFDNIQEAIDTIYNNAIGCSPTIIVLDGIYSDIGNYDIDPNGMAITIKSENGPRNCLIDCNDLGRAFILQKGEGPDTVIDGFTIKNGYSSQNGGAIFCYQSSPTIENCRIIDNYAGWSGGAIWLQDNSNAFISNCTISNNVCGNAGGGIENYASDVIFENCIMSDNFGFWSGALTTSIDSHSTIINCTVADNWAIAGPGGLEPYNGGNLTVTNSIIWDNAGEQISGGFGITLVTCSDVYITDGNNTWAGTGNINTDPLFADSQRRDYHLKSIGGRWVNILETNGDFDDDGFIDWADVAKFTSYWLDSGLGMVADMYPDEFVDFFDYALFAANWLTPGDNTPGWIYIDQVTSPCIDAGDPSYPYYRELRPNGYRINMGAYGNTPQASRSP